MATTNIVLNLEGLLENPVVSGDDKASLERLATLFRTLASSGTPYPDVTLRCTGSAVRSSGTVTFSGAASAADTVTINGTALTCAQKNATGTVTFSSLADADTVTIGGVVFTAKTSPTAGSRVEFALGASDTAAATNLTALVNAYVPLQPTLSATSSGAVVTFRAATGGTAGNAITLASSDNGRAAVSGATLANGAAAANNAWDKGNSAATAATALCDAINASSTAAVSGAVVASVSAGVVTLRARTAGVTGNVTLTKSGSNIAVSAATLTLGALGSTVTLSF